MENERSGSAGVGGENPCRGRIDFDRLELKVFELVVSAWGGCVASF